MMEKPISVSYDFTSIRSGGDKHPEYNRICEFLKTDFPGRKFSEDEKSKLVSYYAGGGIVGLSSEKDCIFLAHDNRQGLAGLINLLGLPEVAFF